MGQRVLVMTEKSLSYYDIKVDAGYKNKGRAMLKSGQSIKAIAQNGKQDTLIVKRRIPLENVEKISLSALADDYVVIHSSPYDTVIKSRKKTEIAVALSEHLRKLGRTLNVNISNTIPYKLK